MCCKCRKVLWRSHDQAVDAAASLARRERREGYPDAVILAINVYACPSGLGYHVGHRAEYGRTRRLIESHRIAR